MQQKAAVTDELVEQINRKLHPAAMLARLDRPGRGRRLHLIWLGPGGARGIRKRTLRAMARDMGLVEK